MITEQRFVWFFRLFPKAQFCPIEKFWRLIKSENLHSFLKEHHCISSKLFAIIIILFYLQSLIFNWKILTCSRPVKDALLLRLIPEFSGLNVFSFSSVNPKEMHKKTHSWCSNLYWPADPPFGQGKWKCTHTVNFWCKQCTTLALKEVPGRFVEVCAGIAVPVTKDSSGSHGKPKLTSERKKMLWCIDFALYFLFLSLIV